MIAGLIVLKQVMLVNHIHFITWFVMLNRFFMHDCSQCEGTVSVNGFISFYMNY